MHTINFKHLEASINPLGAELSSLKVHNVEYLWQGDEKFWSSRAPILFPIVGALKGGRMSYQGKSYEMGKHGLARHATFDCVQSSAGGISMRLQSDRISLQHYPWKFELLVHFALNDSGLEVRYEVINEDEKPMLFTIGSHPAFALNFENPAELADYTISIDQAEPLKRYSLHASGLLESTAESHDTEFSLSETIFNNDALVFRDITAQSVTLSHKGQTMVTVTTGGAPHLGIWAKPGAPFVCIEPWLGTCDFTSSDNQFENKADLKTLLPGELYEHGIGIVFPG